MKPVKMQYKCSLNFQKNVLITHFKLLTIDTFYYEERENMQN